MSFGIRTIVAAVLAAALAGGASAAPELRIEWEITNRFSPFEALSLPTSVFQEYRLQDEDGGFDGWHERLDRRPGGFRSPYADAFRTGAPIHWDPVRQLHSPRVTRFVKAERDPGTTVSARFRLTLPEGAQDTLPEGALCLWEGEVVQPCDAPFDTRVPLRGSFVDVEVAGEKIIRWIKPEHMVIVGVGDSYSSGEGNPDVPAQWKPLRFPNVNNIGWLAERRSQFLEPGPARRWVDDTCHRSFFSYQSLTALRLASEDPHRFVSFLHYSCSGAEIFDGLLFPQHRVIEEGRNGPVWLHYAQVNAAVQDLCAGPLAQNAGHRSHPDYFPVTLAETRGIDLSTFERRFRGSELAPEGRTERWLRQARESGGVSRSYPHDGLMWCPDLRKPDHVFLSIGGNDVAFGEMVRYYILPVDYEDNWLKSLAAPAVCPPIPYQADLSTHWNAFQRCEKLRRSNGYDALDLVTGRYENGLRVGGIDQRFALAVWVLGHRLKVPTEAISMAQYPDPMRTVPAVTPACQRLRDIDHVVYGARDDSYDDRSAWNGIDEATRVISWNKQWEYVVTQDEAYKALSFFDTFRAQLAATAQALGMSFVCDTRDAFVGHGWWTGEHLAMPHLVPEGTPGHWNIEDLDPYGYRVAGRAIRTANDSVLIQPSIVREPTRNTSVSGTFHPNFFGHRLVAEGFYDALFAGDPAAND
ncbi:MAG: hypothetical protein VX874_22805 [Pseudomonadota bacterium]|nr:hypothetical protein [Pseudomonadota bacterium]